MLGRRDFLRSAARAAFLRCRFEPRHSRLSCPSCSSYPSRPCWPTRSASPALRSHSCESASGTGLHDNADVPRHYLPEAIGPGCAFLDYDNDGWMDIYLVNSGPSDFYKPSSRSKCALSQQSRRHLHRCHREGGRCRRHVRHGRRRRGLRQRRPARPLRHRLRQMHSVQEQPRRHVHRRHRKAGLERPDGPPAPSGSTTTTTASSICSCAASSPMAGRRACASRATTNSANAYYCIPRFFKPTASFLYHNNGDGTFTRPDVGTDIARSSAKASAW